MEREADRIIEFRQALINFKSWVYQHKASGSNKESQEWAIRCLWDVEALARGGWHSSAARQAVNNLAKLERMLGGGFSKAHSSERRMAFGLDNESLPGSHAKEFKDPFKATPTALSSLLRAGPGIGRNPARHADVATTLPTMEPAEEMRELLRLASKLIHEPARLRSEVGELFDIIISTQETFSARSSSSEHRRQA